MRRMEQCEEENKTMQRGELISVKRRAYECEKESLIM
jgi:hypothetical protein